jgi:hypothetical protein
MGDCTKGSNEIRIKKIIRNLKTEETRMISGLLGIDTVSFPLIWNQYFELKKPYKGKAKYNLDELIKMDKIEFQQVINDYFNSILKNIYKEEVINELYPIFNLPENSDIDTVKKRFRELAKKMHPDTGGTHEGFIALSQAYENFLLTLK